MVALLYPSFLGLPVFFVCVYSDTLKSLTDKQGPSWDGTTPEDLWNEYYDIFPTGNRNAAAFRWSTFILERSWQMSDYTFESLAGSYCAVAAAIVREQPQTRYHLTLPVIGGGQKSGLMHYCCWPCICDTLDFLKVDTKTVHLNGVSKQYHFAVMGNPCNNPQAFETSYVDPFSGRTTTIPEQAPEVKCAADGSLKGATLSDNGYIIMSVFFEDVGQAGNHQSKFTNACADRAANGYQSGMGLVFRKVAGASPISSFATSPESTSNKRKPKTVRSPSNSTVAIDAVGSALVHRPDYVSTCQNEQAGLTSSHSHKNVSKGAFIKQSFLMIPAR